MNRFSAAYILVAVALFSSAAFAVEGPKTIVLIFPLKVTDVSLSDGERTDVKDYLGTRLTLEGVYSVMPESQAKANLGAAKVQSYNDCYDDGCRIDLTRAAFAQKGLSVDVKSEGAKCRVTAVLYDIRQESTETAADVETGCTYPEIKSAMVEAAKQLSGRGGDLHGKPVGGGTVTRGIPVDRGEKIVNEQTDKTGLLFVDTNPPNANLSINGRSIGTAPYQGQLMVGKYVVVAEISSWYYPARQEVNLTTEGATVSLKLLEAFGGVEVTSNPSRSEVFIDGKPVGKTPYVDRRVLSGDHEVEVRRPLFKPQKRAVTVKDGVVSRQSFELVMDFGAIRVVSDPAEALVLLDGKRQDSPTPVLIKPVKAGSHLITLTLPGYGRHVETVQVDAGVVTDVKVSLQPKYGTLVVMTRGIGDAKPCRGTVEVDGGKVGNTPWKGRVVAEVLHRIRAACGGSPVTREVVVAHNEKKSLEIEVENPQAAVTARDSAVKERPAGKSTVQGRENKYAAFDARRTRASFQARLSGGLDLNLASAGVGGLVQIGVGTGRWFDIHTGVGFPSYVWVTDFEVNLWPYGRFIPTLAARVSLGFHPDNNAHAIDFTAGVEMWATDWLAFFLKLGVGYSWNLTHDISGVYVPAWLGVEFRY